MNSDAVVETDTPADGGPATDVTAKTSAVGAVLGGVLASSCCILPLALVTMGAGGAWMSNLTALSPYQPFFLGLAALSVGTGLWKARQARRAACATDGECAMPINSKFNTIGLWVGGGMAVMAFAVTLAAPLFY